MLYKVNGCYQQPPTIYTNNNHQYEFTANLLVKILKLKDMELILCIRKRKDLWMKAQQTWVSTGDVANH